MAAYERRRNAATMRDYLENMEIARLTALPSEVAQLRRALRGNQEDTNRFFLAREELIPPESFFNPENMGRIMGAGGVRHPD